jgi:RHS repeat-associated protein
MLYNILAMALLISNGTSLTTVDIYYQTNTFHAVHLPPYAINQIMLNGRIYDPRLGRFLSADVTVQDTNSLQYYNRYSYVINDPLNWTDPTGYETFRQNRELGGNEARSKYNIVTHTFVFTTNKDGSVKDTYSWGNNANLHGWNKNQPEDIHAANEAIKSDKDNQAQNDNNSSNLNKQGGDDLDPCVDEAFSDINKPENEHGNWIIYRNCKTAASKLVELANEKLAKAKAEAESKAKADADAKSKQPSNDPNKKDEDKQPKQEKPKDENSNRARNLQILNDNSIHPAY